MNLIVNEITEVEAGNSREKPFLLNFNDFVLPDKGEELPDNLSALYFFYSFWKDKNGRQYEKLLYIGKAKDLKVRIKQHGVKPKNFPEVGSVPLDKLGDYLCDIDDVTKKCFYAYAKVDGRKLERYEAAAIKVFQPLINIKNKKSLGCHQESWFKCAGGYSYVSSAVQHAESDV